MERICGNPRKMLRKFSLLENQMCLHLSALPMHKTVPSMYALHCHANVLAASLCTGIFYVNYVRNAEKCSKCQKSVSDIRMYVIKVPGVNAMCDSAAFFTDVQFVRDIES